jgi:hypothetical protein
MAPDLDGTTIAKAVRPPDLVEFARDGQRSSSARTSFHQQLEGNVLTPRIQAQTIKVPSVLVFLGVLTGGSLAGITGVLLAVPTLATIRVIFDFFRVRLRTEEASGAASATKGTSPGRR